MISRHGVTILRRITGACRPYISVLALGLAALSTACLQALTATANALRAVVQGDACTTLHVSMHWPHHPKRASPQGGLTTVIARQSRFRLLSAFIVVTLFAVVLVGCSGEPKSAPVDTPLPSPTSTTAPVPTDAPAATPTLEPTPVVLGDCLDGMRLQPGEGCRYTGGGSPQANVVLSVQQDGAICREGGPAKQFGLTIDNLRICASNGFERDDAFQSDIVASANADGRWTFYESALSASTPRSAATAAPTNTPTPAPPLNVYESGQTIPDFPSGLPNVVRGGASLQIVGGNVVIAMGNGGIVEYSHATYTCVSEEGCGIENGRVTAGTIRVADPSNIESPTPIPTAAATPEPTSTPTATPVRPGKFSEFDGAGAATWRRMHEGGQIVACYEGLALPRDSFCLSEGFRFTPDYSEILDTKFLVAHLPDGDALVLQGNTTSRAGGDIRLGWITFEDRVITHLEFNAFQASTPVATETPRPTVTPTRAQSGSDRDALVAFYHSTGGASWDTNTNWLSDRPIGEWHGVTTNSNGRVIKLNLPENQLTGEIPPELGGLSNLTGLWLLRNQLTGEIPPELGGLSNLTKLYLFSNQLTGKIPPELSSLSNLTELFLDSNQLTGEIPPELSRLSNLTVGLGLSDNQLTGEIPPELGRLSNLTGLWLSRNQLTGEIPPELGRLSNLTWLWLSRNQLTGCIPDGLRDIAENDLADLKLPDCGAATPTPTPTVVSLEIAEMTPLTSIGETKQLSVTATMSDGSSPVVESALVQWQSSDPWVASVSEGTVTAVGAGNATVTATYEGRTMDAPVSVRISTRSTGAVRVLYAIPSDQEFRPESSETIAHFIVDLQSWYRRELGGLTFSIYEVVPEVCRMSEPAGFYGRGNAWDNVMAGVQHCGAVQHDSPDFVWVVYVDLSEPCDEPHELGAGGSGLTILPDVESGFVPDWYYHCGEGPYYSTLETWNGGLGHELGHTLGLPHPPGCDEGLPTCDYSALMGSGNGSYPETYLRADNKEVLIRSPFIGREPVPGRDPGDAANASSVQGVALGLDGKPLQGLWVSLVAETFWNWGETGGDGTFEIRLREGSSGPSLLSVHAGDAGDCGWLGYYGPDGITALRTQATRVEIGDGNVSGIEVRLPVDEDDLCLGPRTLTGIVLGPDGRPVEGIWLGAFDYHGWLRSGVDGTFEFSVPEGLVGSTTLNIHADEVPDFPNCGMVGYYGPGGFTTLSEDASFEIGAYGAVGIEIRLPATPDELCRRQTMVAGTLLGPDGEPIEGFGIGLIEAEPRGSWPREWGETGPDGSFGIRLLAGQSGSFIVGVYADEYEAVVICNLLGYYGPGGFTTLGDAATRVEVGDADATDIEIRLPASPDQLLPERVGSYRCGG